MKIDSESWPTLSRLLEEWLDLPEASRATWLENLGPEYAEFQPAFRRMLAQVSEGEGFLGTLPRLSASSGSGSVGGQSVHIAKDVLIGPYRLLRELGQGGMGVVWLAEHTDSNIKRPVALKLPMIPLHHPSVAERFARERDILAKLTHPHIARLYDAGVAEGNQPYLALEYVEGEKIDAYCDQQRLGLKSRLRLLLQVLRAVQYAHTNLIVHRDLKPANILVTNDGDVRLLDFGIAKLLTEGEAKETELTRLGGAALTPDYASPEQIAGRTITAASDVYSLGVILYELLTGERPYRLKRDTRNGLEEAILSSDPQRPSQRATDEAKAQARSTTRAKLARSLKGDLDCIVLKALSKEPQNRYLTADAFARDVESYLQGEAVLAQPESSWYRARKFVLRNRVTVGSAVLVVAALGIGLGVAIRQANVARTQARRAEAVQGFLEDIFRANSVANPDPVRAQQTTARELLDMGAAKLDNALADAPEAKLRVLATLSELYSTLGRREQAVAIERKRIATAKSAYGPTHPVVGEALVVFANGIGQTSSVGDLPAVIAEAEHVLDVNHDNTSRLRGLLHSAKGRYYLDYDIKKGVEEYQKAVEILRKLPSRDDFVSSLNQLGQALSDHRDDQEAIQVLSEAALVAGAAQYKAREYLPAIYAYLGTSQYRVLDAAGAEKSFRLALQTALRLNGEDHEDVVETKQRLGNLLCETGRFEEGLELIREAVDLGVRTKGPDNLFTVGRATRVYGRALIVYGRVEEGLAHLERVAEMDRQAKRTDTRVARATMEQEASGEILLGHFERAAQLLNSAGNRKEDALTLARLQLAMGQPDKAEQTLSTIVPAEQSTSVLSQNWLRWALVKSEASLALNHTDEAIQLTRDARRRLEGNAIRPYWREFEAASDLLEGRALTSRDGFAEALPLLQRAVQLGSEIYDRGHSPALADYQVALAKCLLALGRRDQAQALLVQAKAIHAPYKDLGEQFRRPLRELEGLLVRRN